MSEEATNTKRREIRWWERMLVAWLGFTLVGTTSELNRPWDVVLSITGLLIVAAAIGLVELVMAAYYRIRRS